MNHTASTGRSRAVMLSIMASSAMSVMKPSRPWLMPTRGTSNCARRRAALSMVPSPPSITASSARLPIVS